MSDAIKVRDRLVDWCKADDAHLQRVLDIVTNDDNMMDGYIDDMEPIFVEVYGERVICGKNCGSLVFPGHLCWGCEEWTAPA